MWLWLGGEYAEGGLGAELLTSFRLLSMPRRIKRVKRLRYLRVALIPNGRDGDSIYTLPTFEYSRQMKPANPTSTQSPNITRGGALQPRNSCSAGRPTTFGCLVKSKIKKGAYIYIFWPMHRPMKPASLVSARPKQRGFEASPTSLLLIAAALLCRCICSTPRCCCSAYHA